MDRLNSELLFLKFVAINSKVKDGKVLIANATTRQLKAIIECVYNSQNIVFTPTNSNAAVEILRLLKPFRYNPSVRRPIRIHRSKRVLNSKRLRRFIIKHYRLISSVVADVLESVLVESICSICTV